MVCVMTYHFFQCSVSSTASTAIGPLAIVRPVCTRFEITSCFSTQSERHFNEQNIICGSLLFSSLPCQSVNQASGMPWVTVIEMIVGSSKCSLQQASHRYPFMRIKPPSKHVVSSLR